MTILNGEVSTISKVNGKWLNFELFLEDTMKAKELIEQLKKLDPDTEIFCWQKSILGEETGQNRIYRSKVEMLTHSKNPLKVFIDGE